MELLIGIGLVIFGGLLAYHNLKDTVHGEKSAVLFGAGLLIVGIYLIKEFNDAAERSRAENDRQWEMEQQQLLQSPSQTDTKIPCPNCNGWGCPFCNGQGQIPRSKTIHLKNKGYSCGSTGCWCTIKRSELEASGLNRCGCGHLTSYHHD